MADVKKYLKQLLMDLKLIKNMNPAFVERFNEQIAKINILQRASIPQFDVRRERITEWLAQYLLEQKYIVCYMIQA